jgi:hypothetical protein
MAVRDLIKNYLRQAQSEAGATVADQLAWLEARRVALTKELEAGGQAVLSTSFSGQASSFDGGVPVRDRLRAVNAAIDRLNGRGTGGGGTMILPRFSGIPL